jgi:hypothetical protein
MSTRAAGKYLSLGAVYRLTAEFTIDRDDGAWSCLPVPPDGLGWEIFDASSESRPVGAAGSWFPLLPIRGSLWQ